MRRLGPGLVLALVAGFASERLREVIQRVGAADALIVATPVYQAGVSGLVTSFLDLFDTDLLIATPVLLSATAGTSRHALVVDGELRGRGEQRLGVRRLLTQQSRDLTHPRSERQFLERDLGRFMDDAEDGGELFTGLFA